MERVLECHPEIADAAVIGVPDQRLGETIRAYIVAADPASPPYIGVLRSYCRKSLAGFKVPAEWGFTKALPRNAAGKILRRELVSRANEEGVTQCSPL